MRLLRYFLRFLALACFGLVFLAVYLAYSIHSLWMVPLCSFAAIGCSLAATLMAVASFMPNLTKLQARKPAPHTTLDPPAHHLTLCTECSLTARWWCGEHKLRLCDAHAHIHTVGSKGCVWIGLADPNAKAGAQ